jgi:hypothetical protein
MPLGYGYHVLPVNDLIEHDTRPDCICGPEISTEAEDVDPVTIHFIFKHHALDGRERTERSS